MSKANGILTLQEIMEKDFPCPSLLVEGLISEGETALFIARQKEGKSTLSLQLGIDIACGDPFLGQYKTTPSTVLYVDYENRLYRLKQRGIDLANERKVENLRVKAFDYISQRDVGLFGKELDNLKELIGRLKPGLLIIDPLRYALSNGISRSTSEETLALAAIDNVSGLQEVRPQMGTMLVHHLKKRQDFSSSIKLRNDPRIWIEQIYGSQALIAHVDSIYGLEEDGDGYTFATVPRSQDPLILRLEKQPDSERFLLSPMEALVFRTEAQRIAWAMLPEEFGWREGVQRTGSNNILNSVIRQARAAGLLIQDPETKRYRKIDLAQGLKA